MLEVNEHIQINENELIERAIRASGPGGQHVNKVSTAIELRFYIWACANIPDDIKQRLAKKRDQRITDALHARLNPGERLCVLSQIEQRTGRPLASPVELPDWEVGAHHGWHDIAGRADGKVNNPLDAGLMKRVENLEASMKRIEESLKKIDDKLASSTFPFSSCLI